MADNYLERHREDYERRKQQRYAVKGKSIKHAKRFIERPEDDAL